MTMNRFTRNALFVTSAALMVLTLYLVFIWVPTERNLGISQRIFYFHVALAWVGFFAFFWVVVGSVGFLWKRSRSMDRLAYTSAEIGVVFTTLMLVTGITWAKPVWGVWWSWDPKLTTSLILWLIYAAYLMLRAYSPAGDQGSRFAAVLGIVGFVDVPIIYLSVVWWRTIHPNVVGTAATGSLEPSMRMVLMACTVAFTLLFAYLLMDRLSLRRSEEEFEAIRSIAEPI
jgi:heme exporter protein C